MGPDPDIPDVDATLAGDDTAYEALVLRYQRQIIALISRMTGDAEEALDIAQQVFIKAYTKLRSFKRRSLFKTWLYSIAINFSRNELRRRVRLGQTEQVESADLGADSGIVERIAEGQRLRRVARQVDKLPPRQKEVLVLRVNEQMSFQQIAEITGITENSAKVNFHHAVKRLKAELEGKGK